jgi:transcription antitermination factor NusG
MTWYAIATAPGSQKPQREYWSEPMLDEQGRPRSRTRLYRVVSSVNPMQSAVERALEKEGFVHYMPVEYQAVRHRDKTRLYTTCRFALLKGYAFVSEVADRDIPRLLGTAGVLGIIGDRDKPMPIDPLDLFRFRMHEAESKAVAEDMARRLMGREDTAFRKSKKAAIKSARKKLFPSRSVKVLWGSYAGRDASVVAWDGEDRVKALVKQFDSAQTIVVPYEYLRIEESEAA